MYFFISGIVAVPIMTLFSVIWGKTTNNLFSEPHLLAQIINKVYSKKIPFRKALLMGWILHFIIGFIFLGLYEFLWFVFSLEKLILMSIPFGLLSGFIGVLGWKILYKIVDYDTRFSHLHYYIHLIFAHVVFSVTAVLVHIKVEVLG